MYGKVAALHHFHQLDLVVMQVFRWYELQPGDVAHDPRGHGKFTARADLNMGKGFTTE